MQNGRIVKLSKLRYFVKKKTTKQKKKFWKIEKKTTEYKLTNIHSSTLMTANVHFIVL